jgi:hypothetical protein
MGKRQQKMPPPVIPPPVHANLDGIVLHDAWLFCKIFFGAILGDSLFEGLYVPIADPPVWVADIIGTVLHLAIILFAVAALLNAGLSIYFHFWKRIRTKT